MRFTGCWRWLMQLFGRVSGLKTSDLRFPTSNFWLPLALCFLFEANANAVGMATPTDIPGLVILDANVSADDVNTKTVGASGNPPFEPGSTVYKVQTTQPFIAIRSYYLPSESDKSGQAGSWIAPIAETRGLSRAKLMDRLALPIYTDGTRNNTFALVLVPAGVSFWSGPAGAITSSIVDPIGSNWGSGGGIQYYVGRNAGDIPGFQVPLANYVLAAPMGEENLLAYSPRLTGNALTVGHYMDGLTVQAYSDLDSVLTTLDLLNLSTPANDPKLQKAIAQLGAERYGTLGLAGLYQSRLFMDQLMIASNPSLLGVGDLKETIDKGHRTWMSIHESRAKQSSDEERTGFKQSTTSVVAGIESDCQESKCFGVAGGYLSSDLDWSEEASGHAKFRSGYFGGYGTYHADALLVTGQLLLGYSNIDTRRNISIPDAGLWPGYSFALNRTAQSSTHAINAGARLDTSYVLATDQTTMIPFIGLEYQRFYRHELTENGADSINLSVKPYTLDETRLRVGASLVQALGNTGTLSWSLNGHWLSAPRIGGQSGKLDAAFQDQSSTFSSSGWRGHGTLNQFAIGLSGKGKTTLLGLTYNYLESAGFRASTVAANIDWRF